MDAFVGPAVHSHGPNGQKRPDLLQSPENARPGISMKNTEKIPPGPKFWTPRISPKNTEKNTKNAHFWYFARYFFGIFGVFWGEDLGVQNFGPGGIFSVFFVAIPGWAISGSVAGRRVLNPMVKFRLRLLYELPKRAHTHSISNMHRYTLC